MIVNKIICDRCGAEIKEDHPDRIIIQNYHKSDRAIQPSSYKQKERIHLCDACREEFESFMNPSEKIY